MSKILTGVQSTGTPHLGNLLGAIIPAIELSEKPENDSFLFIADLHSVTQIKDGKTLKANTVQQELLELTALTGRNIDNWQDDAAAINDEEKDPEAQYANLMNEVKADMAKENNSPVGLLVIGAVMIGAAGLMRWKGIV